MSNGVSNPIHWRLLYLTVLLLLMLNCSCQECSKKCWFVYKPSETRSQNQEFPVTIPTDRRVTGILTIDGQFNWEDTSAVRRDELRFSKAGLDDPLVLATDASFSNDRNQIVVWGEATFANEAKYKYGVQYWPPFNMKLFPDKRINVQLSDMGATTDRCYKFHIGIPGESEYYEYNYKSDDTWAMFADLRLDATTVISNTDANNVSSYNYISVCADPEPVLCDNLDYEIVDADLGAPYNLTCSGSGAPYLISRWDNDTYRPTFEAAEEEYDNSTADQFIRSTVRIGEFTVNHIGSWDCTIVNMNFKGAVHKTYLLQYSSTVTVTAHPSVETYSPTDGNTSLVWVVEGWPLQQVAFTCNMDSNDMDSNMDSNGTNTTVHTPDFYSSNPPKVTITLTLSSPHLQDLVNCRVLDGEELLDNRTIAKLYNCSPGQYGEGMRCFDCPLGEMSQGGNTYCLPANNSCAVDYFGVGDECRRCPRGTGTEPEVVAVKEQDCRSIATIEPDESRSDESNQTHCVDIGNNSYCNVTQSWTPRISNAEGIAVFMIPTMYAAVMQYLMAYWIFKKYMKQPRYKITISKSKTQQNKCSFNIDGYNIVNTDKNEDGSSGGEGNANSKKGSNEKFDAEDENKIGVMQKIRSFFSPLNNSLFENICIVYLDLSDVVVDVIYFSLLERGLLVDSNISRNTHVNKAILVFALLGVLKSACLIGFGHEYVKRVLRNNAENAPAVVWRTHIVLMMKMVLLDGPELVMQYFYADRYITAKHPHWLLVVMFTVSAMIYIIPLKRSLMSWMKLIAHTRGDYKAVDQDKAFYQASGRFAYLFYLPMLLAPFLFSLAMMARILGMTLQYFSGDVAQECLRVTDYGALIQTPFSVGCLNWIDWIILLLISLTGLVLLVLSVLFISDIWNKGNGGTRQQRQRWNNATKATVEPEFTEVATTDENIELESAFGPSTPKETVSKELNVEAVQFKSSPKLATVVELETPLSSTPKESVSKELNVEAAQVKSSPEHAAVETPLSSTELVTTDPSRNSTTSTSKQHTQDYTMDTVLEVLRKIKIRYPGDPDATPLSTLLSTKKLIMMLRHQYPDWDKTGHVQFIPEARGFDRLFLKQEHYTQVTQDTHGPYFARKELEFQVQERFSSLKDSAILEDSSLTVMLNLQKKTIRHDKLKRLWNNEFDVVVIDRNRGLFICEVKHKEYLKLKNSVNPNYNLDKELKSQENRYKMLSKLRAFCGADLHTVPIHTVMLCRTGEPASRILEEATVERNRKEYKIVVDLNPDEDFSVVWSKILDLLSTVSNTPSDSENIALLTSLLSAIQHVDKLSHLHQRFIRQGSRPGKKNNARIIWSREQLYIIDHVTKCFQHQLNDTATGKLKLCVTGPMGSGKTLLLEQFAEQFSKMFPDSKILLLITNPRFTLLLERLRATCQQFGDNVTVAASGKYLYYTSSSTTWTFTAPCADYKQVLVDEFYMSADETLDVSHVADSNIVLVTSYSHVAARVGDFTCYNLTGSLRSTREIVCYVKEQQDSARMAAEAVPVSLAHNISYRNVTTTAATTGEECIVQCITLIQELLDHDSNVSILVISITPRWLLYQLNQGLIAKDIPRNFKLQSTDATGSGHGSDNITLCDVDEAFGYESCVAILITDKGRLPAGFVAGLTAHSVSRATTVAHVIEINSEYRDEMPLILPTPAYTNYVTPCYVDVGGRTCKGLVQYLSSIVNSDMMNLAISHNKTILVAYSRKVITMIEDIQHSVPDELKHTELKHTVTFECYEDISFSSLNLSKDYIVIVQCSSSSEYTNIPMWTTLPVRRIWLQESSSDDDLNSESKKNI